MPHNMRISEIAHKINNNRPKLHEFLQSVHIAKIVHKIGYYIINNIGPF